MIKGECGVDVIYVVQKVEEVQIIFLRDSGTMIPESCKKRKLVSLLDTDEANRRLPFLDSLNLLYLLLLRVPSVSQQELGKISFRYISLFVGILPLKFQRQNLALQLMLEVQELFNLQLLIQLGSEEVAAQS